MSLKSFSWACLLIGTLPLLYQLALGPVQNVEAASLFSSAMILMAVGFGLVRRELDRLRPEA